MNYNNSSSSRSGSTRGCRTWFRRLFKKRSSTPGCWSCVRRLFKRRRPVTIEEDWGVVEPLDGTWEIKSASSKHINDNLMTTCHPHPHVQQTTTLTDTKINTIEKNCLTRGKVLGEGHFGAVYRGQLALSRGNIVEVAVKEPVDDPQLIVQTSEEAEMMQELEGEAGVPRLYGVTTDSPPSLVMELCPGERLQDCLERGEVRQCLVALVQVCDIVRRLHARGITHRDIHDMNVLVDVSDDGDVHTFLLDFGLAKRYTDSEQQESDVYAIVAIAMDVIPNTKHFSSLRMKLDNTSKLSKVTALLHQALEDGKLSV